MLFLRIRQSEVALADGRLEEAYGLAVAHAFASHRRGQRLIGQLIQALVRRGNEHLDAGRYAEALMDCDKASKLGGNQVEVVTLRSATTDAINNQRRQEERQQRTVANARRMMDQGHLDRGAAALADAPLDVTRIQMLRNDIEHRKNTAANALLAARQSLESHELHQAAQHISAALAVHSEDPQAAVLMADIRRELRDAIQKAFEDGSLDRAEGLFTALKQIDPNGPDTRHHQVTLDLLRETWRHVQNGTFGEARIALSRVSSRIGNAKWLKDVSEQLESSALTTAQLRAGVLAALNGTFHHDMPTRMPAPQPVPRIQIPQAQILQAERKATPMAGPGPLPSQFILHVDAIGSFLVIRQSLVTLGPISSSVIPDIGLMADANVPAIQVERLDEDYFVKPAAGKSGAVAGRGKLLATGERLELSPRCRLTFNLPSPVSTSAVLDLSGARLARPDIRRVILMDQDLIIGPGSAVHVPANVLAEPVILHLRQGQLYCQTRQPMLIDNAPADPLHAVPLEQTIKVGPLSFVVARTATEKR